MRSTTKRDDPRTAEALRQELERVERDLQHALKRAEEIGEREVPERLMQTKRDIIDRYNDDIYALSQLRWELEQALEKAEAREFAREIVKEAIGSWS